VKVAVIDPVVHVLVRGRTALFVDRDQQDVRLFGGQHHMTGMQMRSLIFLNDNRT
jgi:hypothetical protein